MKEAKLKIEEIDGFKGTHDLHLWPIISDINTMSGYIVIDNQKLKGRVDLKASVTTA